MATLASLVVKLVGDTTGLRSELTRAERQVARTAATLESMGRRLSIGITAPLGLVGVGAIRAATDMDSLRRGLEAVSGSTAEAGKAFERLREVAKLPGLGLREAVQGAVNLRAAGLSASLAERSLKGFGNALATVGKGKSELDGVITALGQIASKGKISAEEINQLAERVPQIRQVMQKAFGTANTEELQKMGIGATQFIDKVVTELEKLPRVTGGAKNAFENFSDSILMAGDTVGKIMLPGLTKLADRLSAVLNEVQKTNPVLLKWGTIAGGAAVAIGPLLIGVGALTRAFITLRATALVGSIAAWASTALAIRSVADATAFLGMAVSPASAVLVGLGALAAAFVAVKLRAAEAAAEVQQGIDRMGKNLGGLDKKSAENMLAGARGAAENIKKQIAALEAQSKASAPKFTKIDGELVLEKASPAWRSLNAQITEARANLARVDAMAVQLDAHLKVLSESATGAGAGAPDITGVKQYVAQLAKAVELGVATQKEMEKLLKLEQEYAAAAKDATLSVQQRVVAAESLLSVQNAFETAARNANKEWVALGDYIDFLAEKVAKTGIVGGTGFMPGMRDIPTPNPTVGPSQSAPAPTARLGALDWVQVSLKTAFQNIGPAIKSSLASVGTQLLNIFNPLGIIATIFGEALKAAQPALDALRPSIEIISAIFGKALAPILRGLFPILKMTAIALTYVAQVAFNLAGGFSMVISWILKGVGYLIKGIGDFINWILPGNPANGLVKAGKALLDLGEGFESAAKGFFDAAGAMHGARDDISKINLDDELKKTAEAASALTESLLNVPSGFKIAIARFEASDPRTVVSSSSAGAPARPTPQPTVTPSVGFANYGSITVVASDPEEFLEQLERRNFRRSGSRY